MAVLARSSPVLSPKRIRWPSLAAWLLGFAPIVYLALSGGGYDVIVRSELGLVACWAVLLGALVGVVPRAGLTRASWIAVALLGAFLVWTWIAIGWSSSDEQTLLEVARIATYVGVFLVGLCVVAGDRARALLNGVASALATVAGLALLYRLVPSIFPSDAGARFYEVSQLQWPFEYADAVGEFVALGLPLLLAVALSSRSLAGRIASASGFVALAVCLVLTRSNGGVLAAIVGLAVFAVLGPARAWLSRSGRRRLLAVVAAGFALAVGLAIVTGLAHRLWLDFKQPHVGGQFSFSGSHRYQYWQAAVHAFESSPWHGIGPGTFQFYWAQHNSLGEFVLNAHSLYLEALAELGIVGVVLIVGLFVTILLAGARRALRAVGEGRMTLAAAVAGVAAFCAAAAFDWVWQIGVLPFVAMLLAAVALNGGEEPKRDTRTVPSTRWGQTVTRAVLVAVAAGALVAIIIPLTDTVVVRKSRANSAAGHYTAALADAATAQRLEPSASAPRLQQALVLEQLSQPGRALAAVDQARAREASNWRIWLVASRIATEAGHTGQALGDYRRAQSLNPTSPLFRQTTRLVPIGGTPLAALAVPPGKAGANQYFETIPGVAGNFAPPQAGRAITSFNPRWLANLGRGQAVAQELARLNGGGEPAARLAADTAWPPARLAGGAAGSSAAVREASRRFDPSGSSPISAIADTLAGSDEGGLGAALPVVLAVVLLGAVWAGLRRARN